MVPSIGCCTGLYAASVAERSARASVLESIPREAPTTPAKPPTIWLRMAPEFPLAPRSAARVAAAASAGRVSAGSDSRPIASSRAVSARFVPVSPSGTG